MYANGVTPHIGTPVGLKEMTTLAGAVGVGTTTAHGGAVVVITRVLKNCIGANRVGGTIPPFMKMMGMVTVRARVAVERITSSRIVNVTTMTMLMVVMAGKSERTCQHLLSAGRINGPIGQKASAKSVLVILRIWTMSIGVL